MPSSYCTWFYYKVYLIISDGAYQKYQTGENEFKMGEIFFGLWNLCAIVNGGTVWLYMLNISMMCECL